MAPTDIRDFAIRRDDWSTGSFFGRTVEPADGQAVLRVNRYALTSNNISYAVSGDMLGYWKFFPAEEGWGRLPCFAFADVVQSRHPDVQEGERFFGYFPMSSHLVVTVDSVRPEGFVDAIEHRRPLPPAYNRYTKTTHDPLYQQPYEDVQMLMQPLFMTSWLIDDFLGENELFGANEVLITSASSKTSIALAFSLKQRGTAAVVGLTSPRNVGFVESLGFYDRVIDYDAVTSLDTSTPVAVVDMAGNKHLVRALHEHFTDQMKHNCVVGATHWDQGGRARDLPGAEPQFFFAPTRITKRSKEWGRAGFVERMREAWLPFVATTDDWLTVVTHRGEDAIAQAYDTVLQGRSAPNEGHVLSFQRSG